MWHVADNLNSAQLYTSLLLVTAHPTKQRNAASPALYKAPALAEAAALSTPIFTGRNHAPNSILLRRFSLTYNAELRGRPNRRNTAKQRRFGLSQ